MLTGTRTTEDDNASSQHHLCASQFTSSPRGVRLARRLAVWCMGEWGHPPRSDVSCTVALVVDELAANAVQHGSVSGRDFGLRLIFDTTANLIRIEVSDTASAKHPPTTPLPAGPDAEGGRGLLLVDTLSTRWGSSPRHPLGKTVWAELSTVRGALL